MNIIIIIYVYVVLFENEITIAVQFSPRRLVGGNTPSTYHGYTKTFDDLHTI